MQPVISVMRTDILADGAVNLTPKFAKIAASSTGNNTVIAAVTGKKIRVLSYDLAASDSGAAEVKFQSGASGTDLTGVMYITEGGRASTFNPLGLFETAASTLLNLNMGVGVSVGGHLVYVEV